MFHGSTNKVRDCNHVLLGQRIRNLIVVSEEVGDVCPDIQRILHSADLLRGGIDTELSLVYPSQLLFVLEVTNYEASQVGDHRD